MTDADRMLEKAFEEFYMGTMDSSIPDASQLAHSGELANNFNGKLNDNCTVED